MRGGRAPSENQVCLALHKERSPQGRRCRTKHHQPARRWLNGHVRALEHPAGCAAWVPALSAGPLLVAALLQGLRCCSGLRQCHPGHGSQQLLVGPIAQLAAHVALAAHAVCLLPLLLHPWTAGPAAWPAAHTATPSRLLAQSRRLREPEAVSLNELVESGQERQLSQLTAAATREGASKSTCSTMCGRCGAPDWCLPHWAGATPTWRRCGGGSRRRWRSCAPAPIGVLRKRAGGSTSPGRRASAPTASWAWRTPHT